MGEGGGSAQTPSPPCRSNPRTSISPKTNSIATSTDKLQKPKPITVQKKGATTKGKATKVGSTKKGTKTKGGAISKQVGRRKAAANKTVANEKQEKCAHIGGTPKSTETTLVTTQQDIIAESYTPEAADATQTTETLATTQQDIVAESYTPEAADANSAVSNEIPPLTQPVALTLDAMTVKPAIDAVEVEDPIETNVLVRYNHYKEIIPVKHKRGEITGKIDANTIIEALSLDYAFEGAFIVHLNTQQNTVINSRISNNSGFIEVDVDTAMQKEYFVDVEEDAFAESLVERKVFVAQAAGDCPINTPRKEGCSCIHGNPCVDKYVCDDWNNRFEVAKKNGWTGHS